MPTDDDASDAQVFRELHSLAAERFKQRAIEDAKQQFAGAPPHYIKRFTQAVSLFSMVGRQMSKALGHDPDKVDLLSIARLRKKGLLTKEEISRFSKTAQKQIKRHMDEKPKR